jgi:aspartyl/asparaginyl beta-hydroxylase
MNLTGSIPGLLMHEEVNSRNAMIDQVSQIGEIGSDILRSMQEEISSIDIDWTAVYSDYHTGTWLSLSLLSATGEATDTTIRDCEPRETRLLAALPTTREYLNKLGLRYMWARLVRIEPNGFVWEHRDYQDMADIRRVRLHIPVITNPSAALVVGGRRIHLASGYIWKLNPVHHHGAANLGFESRTHILLDCYPNEVLDQMLRSERLDEKWANDLPPMPADILLRTIEISKTLARLGYAASAERLLLKAFHSHSLKPGATYDFVCRMWLDLGHQQRSQFWLDNKIKFLGSR